MARKKKINITRRLKTDVELEYSLDLVIEEFKGLLEKYGDYNLYLEKDCYYDDYDYDPEKYFRINLMGCRLESDQEYKERLQNQKATKELTKERERKEYERLKKKFENPKITKNSSAKDVS